MGRFPKKSSRAGNALQVETKHFANAKCRSNIRFYSKYTLYLSWIPVLRLLLTNQRPIDRRNANRKAVSSGLSGRFSGREQLIDVGSPLSSSWRIYVQRGFIRIKRKRIADTVTKCMQTSPRTSREWFETYWNIYIYLWNNWHCHPSVYSDM